MTDHHAVADTDFDSDLPAHVHTYRAFLRLLKWAVVAIVILLILIAWIWL